MVKRRGKSYKIGSTLKVGGENFRIVSTPKLKTAAKKIAVRKRKQGNRCRVVKRKGKNVVACKRGRKKRKK